MGDPIYLQFANTDNIRKWSRKPFDGGVRYVAVDPEDAGLVETGWLIEFPWTANGGGRLCWAALNEEKFPYFEVIDRNEDYFVRKHKSPFRLTPDSTEALRFSRKQDAEAFMAKFDLFLLHPVATEHQWIGSAIARTKEIG